jgi:putative transposase
MRAVQVTHDRFRLRVRAHPVPYRHTTRTYLRPVTFDGGYRRSRHAVSALHVHLIFVTTYRHGVLDGAMLSCRETAMQKACADFGADLREFNGEAHHVYLLVEHAPRVAVSALVNPLKGVSARRLRSQFTGRVNRRAYTGTPGPLLLRRILRGRAAEHHRLAHRAAAFGLTARLAGRAGFPQP